MRMRRRNVLASLATVSVLGAGAAAGQRQEGAAPLARMDAESVHVKKDGEVVRTVEDPSTEEVLQLLEETDDDELVVTDDDDCTVYCLEDCPTYCENCLWACRCMNDGCSECC